MRLTLLPLLCATALPAAAAEHVMLVLDASGSMWGQIEGRSKVEIARATVARMLREWKPEHHLGLVAYGHRRKGDCADIETLIPVGPLDAASYGARVDGLNALGMTPLSAAVRHAAQALRASEQKATVILVSDGEETCSLDPCAVGTELERSGVDFTAHVIGFDIRDAQHQAQLRCLAENTGGRYFNARDAAELGAAIGGAVSASVEAPPPPAKATLSVTGAVAVTQPVDVTWSGPADRGDHLAFARPGSRDTEYVEYTLLRDGDDGGQGVIAVRAPAEAGSFELRYVSPLRADAVLARLPVEVLDAAASLDAPDEVVAGTPVTVTARGPVGSGHWFGFAPKGSPAGSYLQYARLTGPETVAELMPPADPGEYELRYVLNESARVLASRPIRVVAAQASISGPATAMAGDVVTVSARGPVGSGHWVGFAPAGSGPGTYRDYARPEAESGSYDLNAPDEPGAYELRYVLNESEKVIASQPITVTAPSARLATAASAAADSSVEVAFEGPRGRGNWIGFAPRGGDGSTYFAYFYVRDTDASPQSLATPTEPGDYDVIFFATGKVLARQAVRID